MWIASALGFFSIVGSHDDDEVVLVRARRRAHLFALRQAYPKVGLSTVKLTPNRDYPVRCLLPRHRLPLLLSALASSVTYRNFKDHVHDVEPDVARAYSLVWSTLRGSIDERSRLTGDLRFTDEEDASWPTR